MKEFDLIARYFSRPAPAGFLGVGDDCALFGVTPGHQLATSTDLFIEGRHFLAGADPAAVGHKALAVNLSDLAAMGARPLACLLSLSLPRVDEAWLEAFASGFYALADQAACPLVGGDTTRSPAGIVINVTVMGEVRPEQALLRSGAKVGDDIWVTGELGAPDIALQLLQGRLPADTALLESTRPALEKPLPPWRFAQQLAGVAHAALDISDGLAQDLDHILAASRCGAELDCDALPLAPALQGLDSAVVRRAALTGGDVYQLCFTAAPERRESIAGLARDAGTRVTRIGHIKSQPGLRIVTADNTAVVLDAAGFDHFS
ncbi:MAG TPA: thiamine-phosphate kinase [Burkholderiaceae bacterium]|nr:thiamine-phosphate kinase [Burkholderiaceae bacterium]